MSELASAPSADDRRYHHGDLRRGLIDAARTILERDGPQALSLRAVAREAGVSSAAPYHHFKDKSELLIAVAGEGFHDLGEALREAVGGMTNCEDSLILIGMAYVKFARANPAIYRVMYDSARDEDAMPTKSHDEKEGGFQLVREALARAGASYEDETGLELACIAAWCSAHGLAEMANFTQFKPLIETLGGEDAFVEGVLKHLFVRGHD